MDPIRDKYIFDIDIPRNHELNYKKVLRASFVYEISLIPYLYLFLDPIRGCQGSQMDRSHTAPFLLSVPRGTDSGATLALIDWSQCAR